MYVSTGQSLNTSDNLKIFGFPMAYVDSTHITVGFPNANSPTSVCRDYNNVSDITLSSQISINTATHGAAAGDDSFTGAGTATVGASSKNVTGNSTSFLSVFQTRSCTGTISSSNGSTTINGTSTKFMSEFAVNDLIGTTGNGFYGITSIASDTQLTTTVAPATGFSSATPLCVESPTIKIGSNTATAVTSIVANSGAAALTVATSQSAQTAQAYIIGRPVTDTVTAEFGYVFVGSGTSGTTVYISQQRTVPYGLSGYNSYFRRVGSFWYDASLNIQPFDQYGYGLDRYYIFELPYTSVTLVNAGTSTSWSTVNANQFAPPTARALNVFLYNGTAGDFTYVRKNSDGSSTTTRPSFASSSGCNTFVACTPRQTVDYVVGAGAGSVYVYGYIEDLAW